MGGLNQTADYYVDNFLVNSEVGYLSEYRDARNENLSDEELLEKLDPLIVETCDGDTVVLFNWGF